MEGKISDDEVLVWTDRPVIINLDMKTLIQMQEKHLIKNDTRAGKLNVNVVIQD